MNPIHFISKHLYTIFKIAIDILYKSIVSNSLCALFFALIYIIINLYKPINYGTSYKDKIQVIDKTILFSAKNQFLYDVKVPYPVSFSITDFDFDFESFIILAQQVTVVVLLVYYKIHFFVDLHRKYR
jgi:hypothetical protein